MAEERYISDKGCIIISQQGQEPVEGELVTMEDGQPAPDGKYVFNTEEELKYIEVTGSVVHFYYKRRLEKGISTNANFIMVILFLILLFIAFKILGRYG